MENKLTYSDLKRYALFFLVCWLACGGMSGIVRIFILPSMLALVLMLVCLGLMTYLKVRGPNKTP